MFNFLVRLVSAEEIATDPNKIKAGQNWSKPKNKYEIGSSLDLSCYYRRSINDFGKNLLSCYTTSPRRTT